MAKEEKTIEATKEPSADLLSAERVIKINGDDYLLRSELKILKTLQQEFSQDIYDLASKGVIRLRFDQLARVIFIGIGEGAPTLDTIEQDIIRVRGLDETRYLVMEWLIACVSTDKDREKNVQGLRQDIQTLRDLTAASKKN